MTTHLKEYFDRWVEAGAEKYGEKQWMLSKWEVCEGVVWPEDKVALMTDSIRSHLALDRGQLAADLGCGGGWITERLRPHCREILGVDFSRRMLSIAQGRSRGPWVQGAIGKLPFQSGTFDRVLSYFVFLNFADDSFVNTALLDVVRVVKKGGVCLIGQMPDAGASAQYEAAKQEYQAYCRQEMHPGQRNDEGARAPLRLFKRDQLADFLRRNGLRFEFKPSFNPFYRCGAARTVPWRFDLIIYKDEG